MFLTMLIKNSSCKLLTCESIINKFYQPKIFTTFISVHPVVLADNEQIISFQLILLFCVSARLRRTKDRHQKYREVWWGEQVKAHNKIRIESMPKYKARGRRTIRGQKDCHRRLLRSGVNRSRSVWSHRIANRFRK